MFSVKRPHAALFPFPNSLHLVLPCLIKAFFLKQCLVKALHEAKIDQLEDYTGFLLGASWG